MRGHPGLVVLAAMLGCARPAQAPSAAPADGYPGQLVSTGAIEVEFSARQRVVARHRGKSHSFEAVLQHKDGELTLVALTAVGAKAFVLQQRGTDVEYTPYLEGTLPFPPQYILQDVHRTLFIGVPGAPLADGDHRIERAGEAIVETWKDGKLHRRRFRRLSGTPAGDITVTFEGGMVPGELPSTIVLDNLWFGYSLTIETLTQRLL